MFWKWKPIFRTRYENNPLHNDSSRSLTQDSIPTGQSLRMFMDVLIIAVCRFQIEFICHEDGSSKILRKFINIRELKKRHFPEILKIHDHNRKTHKSEIFRPIPVV